jgi:uncharacterized BrkB/YihY/UPF0761 family membrane protein
MLDNFFDKANFLRFLKRHFPLKIGLFLALIFAISIYIYISKWIYPHLVSFVKFFNKPKAESIGSLIVLLGFLFVVFSVLFIWKKSREIPKFNDNEIGILFAPNFPEELEKDVDLILTQLKLELKK